MCRIVEGRVHTWGWWRFPGRKGQGAYPVCLVLNVKVGEDFDIRDWVWSCDEAALTGRTAAAWQVGSRGWQVVRVVSQDWYSGPVVVALQVVVVLELL